MLERCVAALLALFFIAAAGRAIARAMELASTVSFLLLALQQGGFNAQIGRVVVADVIAIMCLAVAWSLDAWLGVRARIG